MPAHGRSEVVSIVLDQRVAQPSTIRPGQTAGGGRECFGVRGGRFRCPLGLFYVPTPADDNGNHADDRHGGAGNIDANSQTKTRNCIVWGNTDDDTETDDIDAQLFYAFALTADDVDNNIIDPRLSLRSIRLA